MRRLLDPLYVDDAALPGKCLSRRAYQTHRTCLITVYIPLYRLLPPKSLLSLSRCSYSYYSQCDDLLRFNNVNLDVLTETYHNPFYLQYLGKWPEYCAVQEAPNGKLQGYSTCIL